jgi:hypothetical protein
MTPAQLVREIAVVRDASEEPARRAFAAAALADGKAASPTAGSANDPAARMFGYEMRHADASFWDGTGSRSGTITYLDDERVEQYVGQQKWIAYDRRELGSARTDIGDQVRIARRGSSVAVESIGPNRLQDSTATGVREACSGMFVLRMTAIDAAEIEALGADVAERYNAHAQAAADGISLEFRAAARLDVIAAAPASFDGFEPAALLSGPITGAVRLAVLVRSNRLEAALDAERALVLFAAMLASDGDAIAIDDTGAIFCADQLSVLATRNETRADAFAFAVAAAQRQWPAPQMWSSGRQGVCDELVVCFGRAWRADFAARFLARELAGFADAANSNEDPIVPSGGELSSDIEEGEDGSLRRLASLSYETVDIDVAFLDADRLRRDRGIAGRQDLAAVLCRPVASAIVIAFGNSGPDTDSEDFGLEMRRAETLATALAASFAARGESVTTDVSGTLYAASDLLALALRRCGKSVSWGARVAAVRAGTS